MRKVKFILERKENEIMFDYTEGNPAISKAKIWQVIIELEPELNSDIQFHIGYMDNGEFVKTGSNKRHLRQQRTFDMIRIIQNAESPAAAKQDLEDHLVLELAKDPDVPPKEE